MIFVNAASNTGTFSCTNTAVGVIQLNCCTGNAGQSFPEHRIEKHVGATGMNLCDVHSHTLHDFHAVAETKNYAFLGSTYDMGTRMLVEVQSMNGTARLTIFEHSFGTVSKRNNDHTVTSNGHSVCQIVHVGIRKAFRCNISTNPGIQYAGAVNAKQNTETANFFGIIDMRKSVHAAL